MSVSYLELRPEDFPPGLALCADDRLALIPSLIFLLTELFFWMVCKWSVRETKLPDRIEKEGNRMNNRIVSQVIAGISLLTVAFSGVSLAQDKMTGDKMGKPGAMSGKKMDKMAQGATKPKKDAVLVTTGKFRRVTHNTKGTATIYENPDGTRELHIKDLSTEAGPALRVYLIAAGDATDNASVTKAGFIDLGALKKRSGHLSLPVPKGIDLWKYRAVTIWCDKFDVNFGTAPLAAKQQ
jgi:hypothetical protein